MMIICTTSASCPQFGFRKEPWGTNHVARASVIAWPTLASIFCFSRPKVAAFHSRRCTAVKEATAALLFPEVKLCWVLTCTHSSRNFRIPQLSPAYTHVIIAWTLIVCSQPWAQTVGTCWHAFQRSEWRDPTKCSKVPVRPLSISG